MFSQLSIFTADCVCHPIQMAGVETIWELHTLTVKTLGKKQGDMYYNNMMKDARWCLTPFKLTVLNLAPG